MNAPALLVLVLRQPERIRRLPAGDWDILIRQARHANLLGRLEARLRNAGLVAEVPDYAQRHLRAGANLAARLHLSVRNEIAALQTALATTGVPLVLLKGAAYVAAGLPPAAGRIFSDVDILVPRTALGRVEGRLMQHGWITSPISAYDQHYYRRWMHELPPMQHVFRGSALDVHHTILPPTARYHPDPTRLFAEKVEVPGLPGVYTLSPVDLVLHAATHLFHEGEADNALRDLSDLDLLLRHWGGDPAADFWQRLIARAEQQQLTHPLWLALRFARQVFDCPVPAAVCAASARAAPGALRRRALDALYQRIFRPQHATCALPGARLARWSLYVRGHWLRMPLHLLGAHLLRKAFAPARTPPASRAQHN